MKYVYEATEGDLSLLRHINKNSAIETGDVHLCVRAWLAIKKKFLKDEEPSFTWDYYTGYLPATNSKYVIIVPGPYSRGYIACDERLPWLEAKPVSGRASQKD